MAYDANTKTALANEARRQELGKKVARLRGEVDAIASFASLAARTNTDAVRRLQSATDELSALEAGAGPGLTDEFGDRSSVDLLLRTERFAGKSAAVDYVKANPECTEAEAIAAWKDAAKAATGLPGVIQSPAALGALYRQNLMQAGMIRESTWEAQRAWILATPAETVLGL
jgi:hypothetical protein